MKNSLFFISIATLFGLLQSAGCKVDKLEPVEHDGIAPGPVLSAEAVSLPGAVKITYQVPNDDDLLYIMAQYTNKQNKVIEVKASFYTNSLLVEGFGDASVYTVNLYAVDRSENKSAPFSIDVKPLTPPVFKAFEKLSVKPDFGGVNISTSNKDEADLAIVLLRKDSLGFYVIENTNYTKRDSINYSVRGYDSTRASFAVYVRDRWNNLSDTLYADISPIYEMQLDKTKFKVVVLPTDVPYNWGLPMPGMWDGRVTQDGYMWHSADVTKMPMHITFDLGVSAKLSRFTLWERQGIYLYGHGNPRRYKVYGSTNPAVDGSWDGWVLLHDECVSLKPSGQPLGVTTDEDKTAGLAGEEWTVPLSMGKVQYIRVEILETWSGSLAGHIAEMTFWGNTK